MVIEARQVPGGGAGLGGALCKQSHVAPQAFMSSLVQTPCQTGQLSLPALPNAKDNTSFPGGRQGGFMVSALDSGASGPDSSSDPGHRVVFLGKTL